MHCHTCVKDGSSFLLIIPVPSMANCGTGWIELPMCVVDIYCFVATQNLLKSIFQSDSFLYHVRAEYSFSHNPSLWIQAHDLGAANKMQTQGRFESSDRRREQMGCGVLFFWGASWWSIWFWG